MKSFLSLALLFALTAGCDNKPTPPPSNNPPPAPPSGDKTPPKPENLVPPAKGTGNVSGKVKLNGSAPKPRKVNTSADPTCADQHKDEPLMSEELVTKDVGGENRLQWVAVFVSSKVDGSFEPPKEPAVINQQGCHYEPHIVMMRVNQALAIKNSDPTLHNIHAMPQINREFNFGQKKGDDQNRVFDQPERAIKIKCDVHPWMLAYAFVIEHPFFAVTNSDGTYEIRGLPAGTHELTFWQERCAEWKVQVKVEDGKTTTQDAALELQK